MSRPRVILLLVALSLALVSCSQNAAAPSGQALVARLPDGAEGVDLVKGGLRLKNGYKFVQDTDTTFAITRTNDGQSVLSGACTCKTSGGCVAELREGVIVCEAVNCSDCGLDLMIGGVTTRIIKY